MPHADPAVSQCPGPRYGSAHYSVHYASSWGKCLQAPQPLGLGQFLPSLLPRWHQDSPRSPTAPGWTPGTPRAALPRPCTAGRRSVLEQAELSNLGLFLAPASKAPVYQWKCASHLPTPALAPTGPVPVRPDGKWGIILGCILITSRSHTGNDLTLSARSQRAC